MLGSAFLFLVFHFMLGLLSLGPISNVIGPISGVKNATLVASVGVSTALKCFTASATKSKRHGSTRPRSSRAHCCHF